MAGSNKRRSLSKVIRDSDFLEIMGVWVAVLALYIQFGGPIKIGTVPFIVALGVKTAAAILMVSMSLVAGLALLMYSGLTWGLKVDQDERPNLFAARQAARLACLLMPLLWLALAATLPFSWPLVVAVVALPLAFAILQLLVIKPLILNPLAAFLWERNIDIRWLNWMGANYPKLGYGSGPRLIHSGQAKHHPVPNTRYPFVNAVTSGDMQTLKQHIHDRAIRRGIAPGHIDRSVLAYAVDCKQIATLVCLVETGYWEDGALEATKWSQQDLYFAGFSLLNKAKPLEEDDVLSGLQALVNAGMPVKNPNEGSVGAPLLCAAVLKGYVGAVKLLVKHGADLSAVISSGLYANQTPLELAQKKRDADGVTEESKARYEQIVGCLKDAASSSHSACSASEKNRPPVDGHESDGSSSNHTPP